MPIVLILIVMVACVPLGCGGEGEPENDGSPPRSTHEDWRRRYLDEHRESVEQRAAALAEVAVLARSHPAIDDDDESLVIDPAHSLQLAREHPETGNTTILHLEDLANPGGDTPEPEFRIDSSFLPWTIRIVRRTLPDGLEPMQSDLDLVPRVQQLRYVLVIRTRGFRAPRMTGTNSATGYLEFEPGLVYGDVLAFDLESRTLLDGFSFFVKNADNETIEPGRGLPHNLRHAARRLIRSAVEPLVDD